MKNNDNPALLAHKQQADALRRNKAIARKRVKQRENMARIARIANSSGSWVSQDMGYGGAS